jgi:hypothetical protein
MPHVERRNHRRAWLGAASLTGAIALAGHAVGIPPATAARGVGYALSAWFLGQAVGVVMRNRLIDLRYVYITQTSILGTSFGILALLTITGYTAPRDAALPWAIWGWIALFLFGATLGFEALVRASIRARTTQGTRATGLPQLTREEADTLLGRGEAEIRHARDAPGVQFGASQEAIDRLIRTLREEGYLDSPRWVEERQAERLARKAARAGPPPGDGIPDGRGER